MQPIHAPIAEEARPLFRDDGDQGDIETAEIERPPASPARPGAGWTPLRRPDRSGGGRESRKIRRTRRAPRPRKEPSAEAGGDIVAATLVVGFVVFAFATML